jgi:YbbR domain-containing protein
MKTGGMGEDWSLKAFSLGTAILLFLFVSFENDTPVDVDFRIDYRVADDIILSADAPTVVHTTLQGPWAKFSSFDILDLEPVIIDLSQAGPGNTRHVITTSNVRPPGGMRVVAVLPGEIDVTLDRRVERQVDVHLDIADAPAFGYEVAEVQLTPKKVRVSGPAAKMQALEYITTRSLEVMGREENLTVDVDLRPPSPPLRLIDKRVQAFVVIHEEFVQRTFLGVPVLIEGAPPGSIATPDTVTVTLKGPRRALDKIEKDVLVAVVDSAAEADADASHADKAIKLRPELPERTQMVTPVPRVEVSLPSPRKVRRR